MLMSFWVSNGPVPKKNSLRLVGDLILGDDALLYIAYVILIWAAPIPADRWHCSLLSYLTHWVDYQCPLVAEISCALIVHHRFSAECTVSLI